ncbi:hypothetical protein TNCV_2667811 [Trichonephila clavipes]|nr:hypothetical protein TNCV_2667811 [Trichonephila clavipes]
MKCVTREAAKSDKVKSLVYVDKLQTLDYLEDNIRRVIADIRPQMLEKVIENWTSRLDYIRASRGSHMPEIIFNPLTGYLLSEKLFRKRLTLILRFSSKMQQTIFLSPFRTWEVERGKFYDPVRKKNVEELRNNYYALLNMKDAELSAVNEDLHLLEVRLESLEAEKSVQSIFEASLVGRNNPFCPVGGLKCNAARLSFE